MNRNKTEPPEVGKYYPNMNAVDKNLSKAKFDPKEYSLAAADKKDQHLFKNSNLCSHLVTSMAKASHMLVYTKGGGKPVPVSEDQSPRKDKDMSGGGENGESPTIKKSLK